MNYTKILGNGFRPITTNMVGNEITNGHSKGMSISELVLEPKEVTKITKLSEEKAPQFNKLQKELKKLDIAPKPKYIKVKLTN